MLAGSRDHGGSLDLHQGASVHEPAHLDERHGRVVLSHPGAPAFPEGFRARAIRCEIGHIDRDPRKIARLATRGPNDGEHLIERAPELVREPGRRAGRALLPARLPGDEEQTTIPRREEPVVPALRRAQRFGIDDLEFHGVWAPAWRTIDWPLRSLAPAHRSSTAAATSSELTSRVCPADASTAASAWSRVTPARDPTFESVRSVMGESTYPGQTALTVRPVPANSSATE